MFRLIIISCLFLATFAESDNRPKPSGGRIVGGRDTNITEVPYQVSLRYNGSHMCGGSIIGLKHILTANHCVVNKNPTLFSIRAGSSYRKKGGYILQVVKIISHPGYDIFTTNYDAAVLVLNEPLRFGEGVRPVALANVEPREGDMALISGWGLVEGNKRPKILQSVSLPVVSRVYCKIKYRPELITDQMFCAGFPDGKKYPCRGDSGGPAVVRSRQAGIVSWASKCDIANFPSVYTNIASILSWILAQIHK